MLSEFIKKINTALSSLGTKDEKDYFVENLATLLGAGMNFTKALDAIALDIKSPGLKKVIKDISVDISSGTPFWKALKKSGLLPDYAVSIIKFGEDSGKLVPNLFVVARYQQKQRVFRSKLISAMSYPALVFFITVVVGVLIAWFVLPSLRNVFSQLDLELPLITKIVLAIGGFLAAYGIIAVPLFLASLFFGGYMIFFFPGTKYIGQALLLKTPLIGKLVREIEIARFSNGLGILLDAGSPSLIALDSVVESTPFRAYKRLYKYVRDEVAVGKSFQESFDSFPDVQKLFPASVRQLIAAGEQSGKLADNVLRIGERYEEKVEISTKNLPTVLEPILLFLVWLGVVGVAIAVILPLYQLIGQL